MLAVRMPALTVEIVPRSRRPEYSSQRLSWEEAAHDCFAKGGDGIPVLVAPITDIGVTRNSVNFEMFEAFSSNHRNLIS